MPLTIKEVLETLEDPVALGIDFYADKIHVKGEDLSRVHERILVGDILVAGGTSDLAFYDPATDVLITQKKAPPADDGDRALILHECVHAMIDIIDPKTTITRHMGELAAYLTQTAYSVRKYPTANRTGTEPWDKFWGDLYAVVVQTLEVEPIRGLEVALDHAASTAFQISGAVVESAGSLLSLNRLSLIG